MAAFPNTPSLEKISYAHMDALPGLIGNMNIALVKFGVEKPAE